MAIRSDQKWVLDSLLKVGGWDVLHPGGGQFFEQLGYAHADIERVFGRVASADMLPKAWSTVAAELERRARHWEMRGFTRTALALYHRAGLLYGRAQYSIYRDWAPRRHFRAKLVECFAKVAALSSHRVRRVALPAAGGTVYALFEGPNDSGRHPCLVLLPGMDMVKEDWHGFVTTQVIPRGWCALALDGPGQGEALTDGFKVTTANYEQAVSEVVSWLVEQPEVDPDRLLLLGVSMGSFWGARVAAREPRLTACATAMACYGPKDIIFDQAQPNFRINYAFMSGLSDDAAFDALARSMTLDGVAERIHCPLLMIQGEFDELTRLEDTLRVFRAVPAAKELWVFNDEFHPLGPVAGEVLAASLDWLEANLRQPLPPGHAAAWQFTRDGGALARLTPGWWADAEGEAAIPAEG